MDNEQWNNEQNGNRKSKIENRKSQINQQSEINNQQFIEAAADLWTRACGQALALDARALAYNALASSGVRRAARFARVGGERVGFVQVSVLHDQPLVAAPEVGWVDALVVLPEWQRQGIGAALLDWGEGWLRQQGCTGARAGASLHWFAPGVPLETGTLEFWHGHGYVPRSAHAREWDLGADLAEYTSPAFIRPLPVTIRRALPSDVPALRGFLTREFPGRWLFEFEDHLRVGGQIDDYLLLESEGSVEACCVMTFEDSVRGVQRFYPAPLPRPWGQTGAIGVSAARRGAGFGSALLDAALKHLQRSGVRGCIIDWTDLVTYYERFGFRVHREYEMVSKTFGSGQ